MAILEEYALNGKMLRGVLACLGHDLFDADTSVNADTLGEGSRDVFALAAALECFQAGLLVHDDIMDKDDLRRGAPTMHRRFERLETAAGVPERNAAALGEAIGICAGDIYYFIAWNIIARLGASQGALFSRELVNVCLAQIADVRFGSRGAFPTIEQILEVYAYKTARYTICLPLCAGAILSGRADAQPALETLGLNLGVLFQIKDDYLGLFGDEKQLGKPIGSDIREGKKTPFMILLHDALGSEERPRFEATFGNPAINAGDIAYIRALVREKGVDAQVRALETRYAARAQESLDALRLAFPGMKAEPLSTLEDFIAYSLSRTN
ncbi:polyprenyl synthetase family protein [bacterium]|nr:polyprenyl synthetase family protein [bacterium]